VLPYTPLHHLLLQAVGRPVVATSGNLSDEPICIDEAEAARRLGGIADRLLVHDRPIERPVDDSVVQLVDGAAQVLRRSRGLAPLPIGLDRDVPRILAVGGQLKNAIAASRGADVFLSHHIGDLDAAEAQTAFRRAIEDFLRLLDVEPSIIAHDMHPDYASTRWAVDRARRSRADGSTPRLVPVQHHHAHLAACLADNEATGRALGVVWDGAGLGDDGTIWGGEFLVGDAAGYRRVAHLRPFRLPGGDAASREPRRAALALLHAAWGDTDPDRLATTPLAEAFAPKELAAISRLLDTGFRAPWTTSAGRLFDAVASLLGLGHRVGFEGEAAMALEAVADPTEMGGYPFPVNAAGAGGTLVLDWAPALDTLLDELAGGAAVSRLAARFHNGLATAIADVAVAVGEEAVALTGGCFQNRLLTERALAALRRRGLRPLLHRRVPANDGGLALGQAVVAAAVAEHTS
jgi:hydrogenase maturation protein HypF